jgi:hypothetical protein
MAQQTSVEWLVEQLINNENIRWRGAPVSELTEKAKAMEKEQMIDFVKKIPKKKGITQEGQPYVQYDAEQYYNETYNK